MKDLNKYLVPTVSVIIPCYNVENYLGKCINSVLAQTYKNYEIILIDDGSTDNSGKICDEYSKKEKKISVYHQPNSGVSRSRNIGIRKAKGKYILFLDADDIIAPFLLDEALKYMDDDIDAVFGGKVSIENADTFVFDEKFYGQIIYEKGSLINLKLHFLRHDITFGMNGSVARNPGCKLIKTEICKKVLFDESLKLSEDILWNLELIENCSKICVVKQIWYIYRQHPLSKVHKYNENVIIEFENALFLIEQHIDTGNKTEFFSFCDMLISDIKIIAQSFLFNKNFDLSNQERKQIIKRLYLSKPWIYITSKEYIKYANLKKKCIGLAFKYKMLFQIMDVLHYQNYVND